MYIHSCMRLALVIVNDLDDNCCSDLSAVGLWGLGGSGVRLKLPMVHLYLCSECHSNFKITMRERNFYASVAFPLSFLPFPLVWIYACVGFYCVFVWFRG